MALSRFVVTGKVTLTPDVAATVVAGEPGTGGPAGFGNTSTTGTPTAGKFGLYPSIYNPGDVVYADSAAGTDSGAKLLYQAIGAGNLRAYVQGQDDVGHSALAN